jgi:hypothetical protein
MEFSSAARRNIDTALKILIICLVGALLFIIFRQTTQGDDRAHKAAMDIKDNQIKIRDSIISVIMRGDVRSDSNSVTLKGDIARVEKSINTIKNKKTQIIHSYEKIPAIVSSYDKYELRREFTKPSN